MKNIIIVVIFSILLISCGKTEKNEKSETKNISSDESVQKGKDLFYKKSFTNNISCSDCHFDGTNSNNSLTKYFSDVLGADKRKTVYLGKFSGEDVSKNAGGAVVCWEKYLLEKVSLTEDEIKSLNAYFEFILKEKNTKESTYETIALPEPDKAKLKVEQEKVIKLTGDIINGEKIYNNACSICHNSDKKIKLSPKLIEEFDGTVKNVTFFVRLGKKFMPFFSYEKISTQDIADVTAFIKSKQR
jgi:cytochrome c